MLDNLRRGERGLVEVNGDLLGATGSDGPTIAIFGNVNRDRNI